MSAKSRKPYALIGAEQLTASLYKTGDELVGFRYRFNIVRLDNRTGHVNQWFGPSDLSALLKLVRLLAAELDHDGCVDCSLRRELRKIADLLDPVLDELKTNCSTHGAIT